MSSKKLLEDEEFGLALDRDNNWMSDELKVILLVSNSEEDKIKRIFTYIRDGFKAIGEDGYSKISWIIHHSLKDVFKSGKGNVAEINLLLVAMLRKAGISADPVILSTRDNGYANPNYPLMDEYNYLICVAYLGDKFIPLDASDPLNGYGELPNACYNGWAHIINEKKPLPIEFSADSLLENSMTSVIIINDDKGVCSGTYRNISGKSGSYYTRNEIRNTSLKDYEKKFATSYSQDFSIQNFGIDSLKQYESPVEIHFDFELKNISGGDMLYFNPMLNEGYKTNIFKSVERQYPVEMPFQIDETYLLNMQIPTGYQIDELPKSIRATYGENEGSFEYLIQKDENNIQMRVRIKLNKAFFPVEEYNTLRDFYSLIVKKENEQIVFKKIKN